MSGSGVLLALETSGAVGSVAVSRDGEVVARAFLQGRRTHASGIVPAVEGALGSAGLGRSDLDGIVVGSGPGSFTGVRVAAASAKALVHTLDLPLWAVSSLASAAVSDLALPSGVGPWPVPEDLTGVGEPPRPGLRYVLFDARGDRVYAACYDLGEDRWTERTPPGADTVEAILDRDVPPDTWFAGTGALRHRARIRARGPRILPPPAGMPTADGLLLALARGAAGEPVADPARWEPDYLRATGAERARVGSGG